MSLISTEKPRISNLLKWEEGKDQGYARADGTVNVAAETELTIGSVLGKVTATGKYVPRDPAASNGSEVSAAVCLENVTVAATTDTEVTILVDDSIVGVDALVFDVAHDAGQQATAISELEALGIKTREQMK